MPKISIIIPCYNQGAFIDEAVDSVLNQTFADLEIIIVNDGSSDEETNRILLDYTRPKTRVIHTANQGLVSARNNGIREAAGEYILPLDADDRIGAKYLAQAVAFLDQDSSLGIVYCQAEFFGTRCEPWNLPPYNFQQMLAVNMIFCSAVFRKADWVLVGGYNKNMRYGYEDWDLWLSLIEQGRSVKCLPEPLFFYRLRSGSMAHSMKTTRKILMYLMIYRNHLGFYFRNILNYFKGWRAFLRQAKYGQWG